MGTIPSNATHRGPSWDALASALSSHYLMAVFVPAQQGIESFVAYVTDLANFRSNAVRVVRLRLLDGTEISMLFYCQHTPDDELFFEPLR